MPLILWKIRGNNNTGCVKHPGNISQRNGSSIYRKGVVIKLLFNASICINPVQKSDMIIEIHSDASYLSEPKARGQSGRHLFLTKKTKQGQPIMNNGAVDVVSNITPNAM